jgi:hypothetical protein
MKKFMHVVLFRSVYVPHIVSDPNTAFAVFLGEQ